MGKGNFKYQYSFQYEKVNPKFKCGDITFKGITGSWIQYLGHVASELPFLQIPKMNAHRILKAVNICRWFRVGKAAESIFCFCKKKVPHSKNKLGYTLKELLPPRSPGCSSFPLSFSSYLQDIYFTVCFCLAFSRNYKFLPWGSHNMMWSGRFCSLSLPGYAI